MYMNITSGGSFLAATVSCIRLFVFVLLYVHKIRACLKNLYKINTSKPQYNVYTVHITLHIHNMYM